MTKPPKKLMEEVQDVIRLKHYSYSTEKTYVSWIRHYIFFMISAILKIWEQMESKVFNPFSSSIKSLCFYSKSGF
ncbi:phage integrase N-terminal SAM-like domain-containing protein [Calothrix sp. UHCC 0171]|uniref:phage integrase N-terminal SAM-like domain-containing protein n=1 Tax=Calothrix sp. UHCC 0171 TaxID=3110245 RepID=UPI003A523228